jgi:hypothetical protein
VGPGSGLTAHAPLLLTHSSTQSATLGTKHFILAATTQQRDNKTTRPNMTLEKQIISIPRSDAGALDSVRGGKTNTNDTAIASKTPCSTGEVEQHQPKLSAARDGELTGFALHQRHKKYCLVKGQPQLTLDEYIGFLRSPPSARQEVLATIRNGLPRQVLRQLQTKQGRSKVHGHLLDAWKKLDDKGREEYHQRAAEISSMLWGNKRAPGRGEAGRGEGRQMTHTKMSDAHKKEYNRCARDMRHTLTLTLLE